MPLFIVRMTLKDEGIFDLKYSSMDNYYEDKNVKRLFDAKLVLECEILCGKTPIATVPIMQYERLTNQIEDNMVAILTKRREQHEPA